MTRKVIILIALYFGLGVLINSCGLFQYDAKICDIRFTALNSTHLLNYQDVDRFEDKIGFEIWSDESKSSCYLPDFQLFNSAYALTKCANYNNKLLKSTYELSLNRPIVVNGDTIYAYTNLLAIPDILGATDIEIDEDCNFVTSTIIFRQELVDRITFEPGQYLVSFKCSTDDSKSFSKSRRVIFNE
jgi:hypothetical protein